MSGVSNHLILIILAIISLFQSSCIITKTNECNLIRPNSNVANSIDSALIKQEIKGYEIVEQFVSNDSFILCYPLIKEKFELALKYKDTVKSFTETYYNSLSRKSIVDLNFILFYEKMNNFMLNNSLDSAYKYDLGEYCFLMKTHLEFKEMKNQDEINLLQKLTVYYNRIWHLQISEIFEIFQWKLDNLNRPVFIKLKDNKNGSFRYFLFQNYFLTEIGIL